MLPVRRRRVLSIGVKAAALLILTGLIVSWYVGGALVAPRPRVVGDPPPDLNAAPFTVASTSGSTISGWHTRPEHSNGVVVLIHGLRESRLAMVERARLLHQHGYATVLIDLQGHGESPGEAITAGHLEKHDVRAAVEFAKREHPYGRIGVIGVSMGGASALLASPLEIDALVLESVYPDITDAVHNRVAARLGPFASIPSSLLLMQLKPRLGVSPSELRPMDHLPQLNCPVLIASGAADRCTTVDETQRMFAAAQEPKELWLVDGAAHVDLLRADPVHYRERVVAFFDHYLRSDSI